MKAFLGCLGALLLAASAPASDSGEILAAVSALHHAGLKRDVAALKELYSPDYFHTNPDGSVMKLGEVLSSYSGPPRMTFSSEEAADQSVLVRGDFAVVTEKVALHGRTEGGDSFTSSFRVTYVLERRGRRWSFVNSHSSLLGIDRNPEPLPSPSPLPAAVPSA